MIRFGILLPLLCLLGMLSTKVALGQSPLELAHRIDEQIEQAAVGPLAPTCSDADFLRRVHLDLVGVIPSAEQTKNFLNDSASDKRQREVERLLATPEFNRFMTLQLNVWLLERRNEKNIPQRNWERFLYESVETDKPLDQLMSELVYAEPATELHPANKFLLSREVEPNAVTRDIGRLALGMDLQCAQCHNHPLIDAYHQEDYYGLYAFVHRTSLFTQPTSKQVRVAERPDGEASFRSVFTGVSRDHTTPRLPNENSVFDEPPLSLGELYKQLPTKESSGVPAFSRRQTLATMLKDSPQFRRNLANRLWAHMFGRGLVHPLDFHHLRNAPSHPVLLDLLAQSLADNRFKLRPLLAAIALSRTYGRSCEPPPAESINFADITARCELLDAKLSALRANTQSYEENASKAEAAYSELLAKHDANALEQVKAAKEMNDASAKLGKDSDTYKKADEAFQKVKEQSNALNAASEKLKLAVSLLNGDKELLDTSTNLEAKAKKLATSLAALEKSANDTREVMRKSVKESSEKSKKLVAVQAERVPARELRALESAQIETSRQLASHTFAIAQLESQIALCKALAEYQSLRYSDATKAQALWQTIVDRWTINGQLAPLRPLSPEQLTLSAMRGTGMLARYSKEAAAQAQSIRAKADAKAADKNADKSPEKNAAKGTSDKPASDDASGDATSSLAALEQLKLVDTVRNRLDQFATLYGGLPGEDFQATVNQALFIGNGGVVDEWLKPGQNNLTDELTKLDAHAVADAMFLSILSRLPSESEKVDVEKSLSVPEVDKVQVIRQWLWALVTSSEFRFNH